MSRLATLALSLPVAIMLVAAVVSWRYSAGPPSSEEILLRSETAMAGVPMVHVETAVWPAYRNLEPPPVELREFAYNSARVLYVGDWSHNPLCSAYPYDELPYANRGLDEHARLPQYGERAPYELEFLGARTLDGERAWVIRYTYARDSAEGPILMADTEWVSRTDYRLLRVEREERDTNGFFGQTVSLITPIEEVASACPAEPRHAAGELRPLYRVRFTGE